MVSVAVIKLPNFEQKPQGPAACRYIPAYLAIDMEECVIGKSSVIAMSYDTVPYAKTCL